MKLLGTYLLATLWTTFIETMGLSLDYKSVVPRKIESLLGFEFNSLIEN